MTRAQRTAAALGVALLATALPANAGPVILAAAAAGAPYLIGTAAGSFTFAAFAKAFVINMAISAISGALAKPNRQQELPTYQAEARDRQVVVRSSVETHRVIYGQASVSGPLVYAEVGSSILGANTLLHLVIPLAGHEVEEIGAIYFDDTLVPFETVAEGSAASVPSGRFAGFASVVKHLGSTSQTADALLVSESAGKWTSDHRLRGIAYIYVRLLWNENIYTSGVPNIKAVVKGKKLYDPRTATTAWSDNWALCVRDYLTSSYGLGCASAEIDDDAIEAAANIADEVVTLSSGSQLRYTCNGTVNLADRPVDILTGLLTAGAGAAVYTQGKWRLFAGAYRTPSHDIDADWLRAGVQVKTRRPRRELYNGVRGTFSDPDRGYQPTDFPPVKNATYVTQDDGEEILRDIELPFTDDVTAAQRIAKIHLEKSRQGITVQLPCNMKAFPVAVWDTVRLTLSDLGWSSKVFLVTGWKFNAAGGVDLALAEEASSCYDWVYGDATAVDTAPDTALPDPFADLTLTLGTPASGTAELFVAGDGTVVPRVRLPFTTPNNPFVKYYEAQFARSSGSPQEWQDAPDVAAPATQAYYYPVEDGVAYDLRLRAVTTLGNAGAWAYAYGHTVAGKTQVPSDVTGLSVVQQGAVVLIDCDRVPDADLDAVEIRYIEQGGSWADASPLTNILRGETSTSAALPPGAWDILAKAKDTSGNYSATEDRVSMEVTATGYISIASEEQSVDWLGSRYNLVKHWTGVLYPDSTKLASEHTKAELFEQFVPYPQAECWYEAPSIDKGIDASARVWADIVSVLGPGVSSGVSAPRLQIDHRLAAGSFDGFENWTVGAANFRYLRSRMYVDTSIGKPVISGFEINIDNLARTEEFNAQAIGSSGTAITFDAPFHDVPVIQITPIGTTALIPSAESPSATGFTAHLYNTGGTGASGTANITATGP